LSYSIIICIVCHTVKPDFVASVEHERLQARRCREAAPERDARVDDLRQRAQARRHREATPERDTHLDDLRQRAQARRHREATPERDALVHDQRQRAQARRHKRQLLREMLVWMVKDAERKLGGIERPLLRDERLDAQRRRTEARRCGETTSVRERYARKIVSDIMHEEKLIIKLHCLASLLSIKR